MENESSWRDITDSGDYTLSSLSHVQEITSLNDDDDKAETKPHDTPSPHIFFFK